jgi:hypothetical protein
MRKLLLLLCLASQTAFAGGSYYHNDDGDVINTTVNQTVYNKRDHRAEYIIGGAILTCAVVSIWKQRWCWQDKQQAIDLTPKHDDTVLRAN